MTRTPRVVVLLAAVFLAAGAPRLFAEDSVYAAYVRKNILEENDPFSADTFLANSSRHEFLKASNPILYQEVFLRAAELKDLQGLLGGESDVRTIRLGLLSRQNCSFCLDPIAFPVWAKKHLPYLDEKKLMAIDAALWDWEALSTSQKAWIGDQNKKAAWLEMSFLERHELMRRWALEERDALLEVNPADAAAVAGVSARALQADLVLGNLEMAEVWKRLGQAKQASASLAKARAKVGKSADSRQKALLAEAVGAATLEARLAALSRFFENLGERPRELFEVAPPRGDQRFDETSLQVIGSMLKPALLKETEGTFAGRDLKEFYVDRGVPLEIRIMNTANNNFLGWYDPEKNILNFNRRFVEQFVKSRGMSVEDLKRDPALFGDLARMLVGVFVHEAQHHRQDVWARDSKMPRHYHLGDEVEAFQTASLFAMEKMERDPKFRAFAAAETGQ